MRRVLSSFVVAAGGLVCLWFAGDLRAADAAAAQAAAVTLRNSDVFAEELPVSPATGGLRPISIVAARNGAFSGRVVVESAAPIKGLRATAGPLSAEGATISGSNVTVRYAVTPDSSWGGYNRLDFILETPPAQVVLSNKQAVAAVWLTVKTERGTRPGVYKGTLQVEAVGLPTTTVPVELKVADWTLPDSQDYATWVDMIQSPDSLALEYKVPLWSEAHWKLIAQAFDRMKGVGCRNVYIPLVAHTNFGNEESMVRWVKKGENDYDFDFSIMDKYLDLAVKHLGLPKMVTFQSWEVYQAADSRKSLAYRDTAAAKEIREELKGRGPRVTVLDPKTGKTEMVYLPTYDDPASKPLWRHLFSEVRKKMRFRDLEQTMMIGVISDVWPSKEDVAFLNEVCGGLPWVSHAHPGVLHGRPAKGNKILYNIADVGFEAHVYDLNWQVNPDKGRQYGWRNPQLECRFARNGWPVYSSDLQMRNLMEINITGGQRGLGRIGVDVWPILRNKRGARDGAVYNRYPEVEWRNLDIDGWMLAPGPDGPVSTARLENFREGVQESQARITIEKALVDPALKARLGDALAQDCQKLLDERQRALWRSIWNDENDLKSIGAACDREPIEAIWNTLTKAHKKLAGYWDGSARKMRDDEDAQGCAWFSASSWQQRNERLFILAGQVERKLPGATAKSGG